MTDYIMKKLEGEDIPTFGIFIQKSKAQVLRNPDLIYKYYKKTVLGKEFYVPNVKPLPSLV